jgi:phosphatidylserine/phosphatidylglycerophosphate/cardiolipin synthase-like enzyme
MLLSKAKSATRRIALSALYVGTSERSEKLMSRIARTAEARHSTGFRVNLLFDYARMNRRERDTAATSSNNNAATTTTALRSVLPLVEQQQKQREQHVQQQHPEAAKSSIALLRMPQDPGHSLLMSSLVRFARHTLSGDAGSKIGEAIGGVHHMKLYVFDDDVIISGANLDDAYYTTRQDRYVLVRRNRAFARFCQRLIALISASPLCVPVTPDTLMVDGPHIDETSTLVVPAAPQHCEQLRTKLLEPFEGRMGADDEAAVAMKSSTDGGGGGGGDTHLFPTLQFASLGIRQDEQIVSNVLQQSCGTPGLRLALLCSPPAT